MAQKSREEGKIGSESREKGDLPPCPPPPYEMCIVKILLRMRQSAIKFNMYSNVYVYKSTSDSKNLKPYCVRYEKSLKQNTL